MWSCDGEDVAMGWQGPMKGEGEYNKCMISYSNQYTESFRDRV